MIYSRERGRGNPFARKERNAMTKFDQKLLQEMKGKLNIDLLGVASVAAFPELKKLATPLLPGAKSLVALGKEVFQEVVAVLEPYREVGEAKPADFFAPHCDYLNGRLTKAVYDLAGILRKEGYRSFPLPAVGAPVDQRFLMPVFSYKHAAEWTGLGSLGRHTMLITEKFGPRVRLACLLTDAPLEPSAKKRKDYCIQCNACIRICPAQALQVPRKGQRYSMNPHACRTYRGAGLTCSVCMKACDEALGKKRKG
jgi:epoxyqueuosine reductase